MRSSNKIIILLCLLIVIPIIYASNWTESCPTPTPSCTCKKAGTACAIPTPNCYGVQSCSFTCPSRGNASSSSTCSATGSGGTGCTCFESSCMAGSCTGSTCGSASGNCAYTCNSGFYYNGSMCLPNCTYSGSGNWVINCGSNCVINSNQDLLGRNITITGIGSVLITANITNWQKVAITGVSSTQICRVTCKGGCFKK